MAVYTNSGLIVSIALLFEFATSTPNQQTWLAGRDYDWDLPPFATANFQIPIIWNTFASSAAPTTDSTSTTASSTRTAVSSISTITSSRSTAFFSVPTAHYSISTISFSTSTASLSSSTANFSTSTARVSVSSTVSWTSTTTASISTIPFSRSTASFGASTIAPSESITPSSTSTASFSALTDAFSTVTASFSDSTITTLESTTILSTLTVSFSALTTTSVRRPIDTILRPPVQTISQDSQSQDPYTGLPYECLYTNPFSATIPTWCVPLRSCATHKGTDKSISCDQVWRDHPEYCGDPSKLSGDSWCKVWYSVATDPRAVSSDGKHNFFDDLPKKCHIKRLMKSHGKHEAECKELIAQKAADLGIIRKSM